MTEKELAQTLMAGISGILPANCRVEQHRNLLYQIHVDTNLEFVGNPKNPSRGHSAFQTDLCIFEDIKREVQLPRVVIEVKKGISTHDVITYSAKARRHKNVYPYLRYGLFIVELDTVPSRFFTHNEALDFAVGYRAWSSKKEQKDLLKSLVRSEVRASKRLQELTFGTPDVYFFRNELKIEKY